MLIKDRIICSFKSKNAIPGTKAKGKFYARRALESIMPRVEGQNIYLNHQWDVPKGRRKFEDLIGRVVNCHIGKDALRGDYELSDYHPESKRIQDHFEKNLNLGGISPDWSGIKWANVDGEQVVMEIGDVNSIDFVAEPAGGRICESDETPLPDSETKFVEVKYVPQEDYDRLVGALAARVQVLESKSAVPVQTPAYAPTAPAPSFIPTQVNIKELIQNVRGN
jgi:hypothetical protein